METAVNPSKRNWLLYRALPRLLLLCIVIVGTIELVGLRYTLMVDPQDAPCIPGKHLFLVDRADTTPVRGAFYAMRVEGIAPLLAAAHPATNVMRPFYRDGKYLIKALDGLPGDAVVVADKAVTINGEETAPGGLLLKGTLLREAADFERSYALAEDEFFMAGRTDNSFDSRYWGPISRSQIVGRAYPLM